MMPKLLNPMPKPGDSVLNLRIGYGRENWILGTVLGFGNGRVKWVRRDGNWVVATNSLEPAYFENALIYVEDSWGQHGFVPNEPNIQPTGERDLFWEEAS